jgi:hypothetical protein
MLQKNNKLSINLGFLKAQADGAFAICALVFIILLVLGWTLL